MKKAGVFLLILLCVLTCVVTTMGEFLYSAFFGDTAQASGTQYALSMDENGIVYYVENLDGVNHIVKVDDLGNIIVDEELRAVGKRWQGEIVAEALGRDRGPQRGEGDISI